jgi:hypothetical protein
MDTIHAKFGNGMWTPSENNEIVWGDHMLEIVSGDHVYQKKWCEETIFWIQF